jgi:endonuclease III
VLFEENMREPSISIIREKLSSLPTYSEQLGINLNRNDHRFRWLLASTLFSKRISSKIAGRTYREFVREHILTPEAIMRAGYDKVVGVLDAAGYVRYDFSTAANLLSMAKTLKENYGGLEELYDQAKDSKDLEKRLTELSGVGPTTVNIFLRELKSVWKKANPAISPLAREVMAGLDLGEQFLDEPCLESRLVRIKLEFCKQKRCLACPLNDICKKDS